MDEKFCYLKCFEEQIYDSVNFIYLAERFANFDEDEMNFFYYHSLCRASMLSSTLLLESAANCCIDSLDVRKKYIGDLAKEVDRLSMLSKFEFILKEMKPEQNFNRGCLLVQKIQEIKGIRDRYVHPKIMSAEWIQLSQDTRGTDCGETKLLKVPFRFHRWKTEHAIIVLKTVNDFFNLFFLEWCRLDTNTVCGLLLQDERVPIPFNASVSVDFMGGLDKAVKDWGVDFRFIGKRLGA
jgi:hypothetical protein